MAGNAWLQGDNRSVYWSAIPANVVSNARAFAERLAAPQETNGAGETPGVGIVHTSGAYHGPFQPAAVYSTVVPSGGAEGANPEL
jgi:hypothetical protein